MVDQILADHSQFRFSSADEFRWSPSTNTIHVADTANNEGLWTLLHELGHALLDHKNYFLDIELIDCEVEAWTAAKDIAKRYGFEIDQDYIEDCLDSYRDWLHERSTCPTCLTVNVQSSDGSYHCFNCTQGWNVSNSLCCKVSKIEK